MVAEHAASIYAGNICEDFIFAQIFVTKCHVIVKQCKLH